MFPRQSNQHWLRVVLITSMFLGVISCTDKKSSSEYQAEAQAFFKQGDVESTVISLKNAISIDPSNFDARLLLGRVYLDQGNGLSAVKEFRKALSIDASAHQVQPLLARGYLISEEYQEIIDLTLIKGLDDEDKIRILAYKVIAHLRLDQLEPARQLVIDAEKLSPSNQYTSLASAYLSFASGDNDKAANTVKKLLSSVNDNPEAYMLQARIALEQEELPLAISALEKYVELQPVINVAYLLLAETLLNNEQYQAADKNADIILASIPNQPLANYIKASVAFSKQDYKTTKRYIDNALLRQANHLPSKLVAGASEYYLANYEQANYHLADVVKYLPADHPAQRMYVIARFQLGLVENIADILSDFTPETEEDSRFLSTLSANLYSIGAVEQAKQLLSKSKTDNSGQKLKQSTLKLMMNDSSAIPELEAALSANPELDSVKLMLAYAAMKDGDFAKAQSVADSWLADSPNSANAYNLSASIQLAQQKPERAREILNQSLLKEVDNFYALTELARLNYQQGEVDKAKQQIERALVKFPDSTKVLRFNFAINKDDSALNAIEQAYKRDVDNVPVKLLYSQALISSEKYQQALGVLDSFETNIQTPKSVWQQRVIAHNFLKENQQVQSVLEDWQKTNPYHIEPILLLANVYKNTQQLQKALSHVNKALANGHAENLLLKLTKMELLLDTKSTNEANRLLTELRKLKLNDVVYDGISGRIKLLEQNYAGAVRDLSRFYDQQPTGNNAILLSIAHQKSGNGKQAIDLLEKYLAGQSADGNVRAVLANAYLSESRTNALEHYEILVEQYPQNVMFLNNAAWLKLELNELDAAQNYIEQAYELAPDIANVADTYAKILLKRAEPRKALEVSKSAYELAKGGDIEIALNYAEILIANTRQNEAKRILLTLDPQSNGQKSKIEMLLAQL